jgi:hypothetical protein
MISRLPSVEKGDPIQRNLIAMKFDNHTYLPSLSSGLKKRWYEMGIRLKLCSFSSRNLKKLYEKSICSEISGPTTCIKHRPKFASEFSTFNNFHPEN